MKYAVVDMGSNTLRLAVYQKEGGVVRRLLNQQKTIGLAGYVKDNRLSEDGIQKVCRALVEYGPLLDALAVDTVRVFATASLRNVSNGDEAAQAIRAVSGYAVDILSGAEEADLSFRGTLLSCHGEEGLLADIGGGSTEVVYFKERTLRRSYSFPFGSLYLFQNHVSGLLPTVEEWARIRAMVLDALAERRGDVPECPLLLGAGGTIESVGVMLGAASFSARAVFELLSRLRSGGREALMAVLSAVPERVHTLAPGLIILGAVLETYGVEELRVSETDIRDGYLNIKVNPSP